MRMEKRGKKKVLGTDKKIKKKPPDPRASTPCGVSRGLTLRLNEAATQPIDCIRNKMYNESTKKKKNEINTCSLFI